MDPKILFFSGGTALNSIIEQIKSELSNNCTYVLPISDNGGSTAEIVRICGGPAIGDIRSRMIRLADASTTEAQAVHFILQYRLNNRSVDGRCKYDNPQHEWFAIVDGSHPLWSADISEAYKETIRMFLVYFNTELMKRQLHGSNDRQRKPFDYDNCSIGNCFFTGARMFFNSLDAAIFWFSRVSGIHPNTQVVPVVNSNRHALNIGAELVNGDIIMGQNNISHPSTPSNIDQSTHSSPNSLITTSLQVNKTDNIPLPSPIQRIFYLNDDGNEISLDVNPIVVKKINEQDHIVYAMGSLYTSIIPCLILKGVGEEISKKNNAKILLLNTTHDRETFGMNAVDFILAITNALNRGSALKNPPNSYITHILCGEGGLIPVDHDTIQQQYGIQTISIPTYTPLHESTSCKIFFQEQTLCHTLKSIMNSYNKG